MGIGMRELIVILLLVLLVFGAKKLRTIGSDLGAAVRGFKKSVNDGENEGEDVAKQLRSDAPDADFSDAAKKGESAEKRDRNA
jgi:sec-independent protein translocase protein TatA